MKENRLQEVLVLLYRLFLGYVFYQIARLLFYLFNKDLMKVDSLWEYLHYAYRGMAFDTTALLYVNAVFILFSILPLFINTTKGYQKFLFYLYFITNGVTYLLNYIDMAYYPFSQTRLTRVVFSIVGSETNLHKIFFHAILDYPLVPIAYILMMWLWIYLYKKVKVVERKPQKKTQYFLYSLLILVITGVSVVGGIRGGYGHGIRPINMVDANRHVKNPLQANFVLNSVFSFFRTINHNNFKEVNWVSQDYIDQNVKPYKLYTREVKDKPNIVIFIVESFGSEYIGAQNQHKNIKDYVSYTPFLDSLAKESLIFEQSYANGRQSIHGMSSVLSGIPALKDAFTSSPYSNQKIQSIVSVCNDMGYDTSFYHGAHNGSMGFLGFANILGFKHYFGMTEYNNENDFDGAWAIWDEPFFQYFANNIGKQTPFMSTIFTASSHHPFKIPKRYEGKFKKGNLKIHEPIQYTDYSLKKFFKTAKTKPWYQNTIFVITADHVNMTYYSEYEKPMNRFAVPVIFFSPNKEYNLKGVSKDIAQQMDIYPTLVDLIGYNKPIRSWGRSLVAENKEPHLIVNSTGIDQFIIGDYIYIFDGENFTGLYKKDDLGLKNNLINKIDSPEIKEGMKRARAWYQDYMYRIINKKLQ